MTLRKIWLPLGMVCLMAAPAMAQMTAPVGGSYPQSASGQPSAADMATRPIDRPPLMPPDNGPIEHDDHVKVTAQLRASAEAGDAAAQYEMAEAYIHGYAVKVDFAQARAWYIKSAAQDFMPAMIMLAQDYAYGWHGPKDVTKAADLYKKLDAAGAVFAASSLANMYQTAGDTDNAIIWYQASAARGDPYANFNLAQLYRKTDPVKALALLQTVAAKDDNSPAYASFLYVLSDMYYFGEGTPVDYPEAYRLSLLAANLGYPEAQHRVGAMLYQVQGVPQDDLTAFVWLKLSAENKDPDGLDDYATVKGDITRDQMKIVDARLATLRKTIAATIKARWDLYAATMATKGIWVIPPANGPYPR